MRVISGKNNHKFQYLSCNFPGWQIIKCNCLVKFNVTISDNIFSENSLIIDLHWIMELKENIVLSIFVHIFIY